MVPPARPSCTDQATPWFAGPETVAVKVTDRQASTVADDGLMVTAAGTVTVTAATCCRVVSAWLAATTWYVPATAGAVYTPAAVTDPPAEPSWTDQMIPSSDVPVTVAAKLTVP